MYISNLKIKNKVFTQISMHESDAKFYKYFNEILNNYASIFILTQEALSDGIVNNITIKNAPKIKSFILEGAENCKSEKQLKEILNFLLINQCNKDSLIVGIGGGTVSDITGFVSSIYMRGIKHILIPTTLLGMVDASIGGKTGVNSNNARNVIGTFKQPKAVYIDPLFLKTLSSKDIIDGFAEVIKYGLIADINLYKMISSNFSDFTDLKDLDQIESIIYKCCKHKINFVLDDEFDNDKRMILNFGHTIGHAIESYFNYEKVSHGEAVYHGMIAASFISMKHGLLKENQFNKIYNFIFNITEMHFQDIVCNKLYQYIKYDKKRIKNKNYFIVLNDIGKALIVDNVTEKDIKDAINFIMKYEYSCN